MLPNINEPGMADDSMTRRIVVVPMLERVNVTDDMYPWAGTNENLGDFVAECVVRYQSSATSMP